MKIMPACKWYKRIVFSFIRIDTLKIKIHGKKTIFDGNVDVYVYTTSAYSSAIFRRLPIILQASPILANDKRL